MIVWPRCIACILHPGSHCKFIPHDDAQAFARYYVSRAGLSNIANAEQLAKLIRASCSGMGEGYVGGDTYKTGGYDPPGKSIAGYVVMRCHDKVLYRLPVQRVAELALDNRPRLL